MQRQLGKDPHRITHRQTDRPLDILVDGQTDTDVVFASI